MIILLQCHDRSCRRVGMNLSRVEAVRCLCYLQDVYRRRDQELEPTDGHRQLTTIFTPGLINIPP